MGEAGSDKTDGRRGDPTMDAAAVSAAIARGDPGAFASFYEAWFDRLYAGARALTRRDESFCLDIVQEMMLRIARSLRPMPNEASLERWLTRVLHTTALDLLRREARRTRRELGRHAAAPATVQPSAASELDERIAWVRERLKELPPEDRWLLGLRFRTGATLKTAGEHSGISPDAVHGRVRRIIARLRASAKEVFDEPA